MTVFNKLRSKVVGNKKRRRSQPQASLLLALLFCLGIFLVPLIFTYTVILPKNAAKPIDAFLVLGGSITREIYVSQLAKHEPEIPILISQGSPDPCILLIFERDNIPQEKVWLEKCADSTFGNFFYSIPILKQWGVKKVKVITSVSHLPRAKLLAEILLGAQGIGLELDLVAEKGIPGNQESVIKTSLDVTRSLFWALLSQVIQPPCSQVIKLVDVDIHPWIKSGFKCEAQGGIE
ncbi:MAG: YdcF family protein [Gomphosphaeria aponina SAG 52.96 = DSM 107014]|uniref:YdcF family protein n=1 Tax=Gomphosphaeria aponina SAG 52.96 = DSM 107014 TaxID=1521640 RepID=A0A941GT58_9CHRO|nr:YdcF family protein [Gomphosphaeria aponina SAG 52.96 = DSM 107014]